MVFKYTWCELMSKRSSSTHPVSGTSISSWQETSFPLGIERQHHTVTIFFRSEWMEYIIYQVYIYQFNVQMIRISHSNEMRALIYFISLRGKNRSKRKKDGCRGIRRMPPPHTRTYLLGIIYLVDRCPWLDVPGTSNY